MPSAVTGAARAGARRHHVILVLLRYPAMYVPTRTVVKTATLGDLAWAGLRTAVVKKRNPARTGRTRPRQRSSVFSLDPRAAPC